MLNGSHDLNRKRISNVIDAVLRYQMINVIVIMRIIVFAFNVNPFDRNAYTFLVRGHVPKSLGLVVRNRFSEMHVNATAKQGDTFTGGFAIGVEGKRFRIIVVYPCAEKIIVIVKSLLNLGKTKRWHYAQKESRQQKQYAKSD